MLANTVKTTGTIQSGIATYLLKEKKCDHVCLDHDLCSKHHWSNKLTSSKTEREEREARGEGEGESECVREREGLRVSE